MALAGHSELVDSLVIDVHRAVSARHGETVRPILRRWGLPMPGMAIDLAEFALAGSLTEPVALARFPFLPADAVREGLAAMRSIGSIEPDLRQLLAARAETAGHRWVDRDDAVDRASVGASEALAAGVQPLAVAYRALPLPDERPMRLHHLLTGLRYERLGAHVVACDRAELSRPDAVALSRAWSGAEADEALGGLVERGLVDVAGAITTAGRRLRDRIEAATEAGCEPMWSAVTDLDGWLAVLGELA